MPKKPKKRPKRNFTKRGYSQERLEDLQSRLDALRVTMEISNIRFELGKIEAMLAGLPKLEELGRLALKLTDKEESKVCRELIGKVGVLELQRLDLLLKEHLLRRSDLIYHDEFVASLRQREKEIKQILSRYGFSI